MTDYRKEYEKWSTDAVFDAATKAELKNLSDEEIKDRFYKQLTFGTGGLRGVIGAGTNRMNFYTVGKATQGLSEYINSKTDNGSVVIAYDSRKMSAEFALNSALIFCANGIKTYLFEGLRPTPELSFAVRYLKTTAGIVITASHNPPQYNGYKVYWSDGAQIVKPYDEEIIAKVNAVKDYSAIKRTDEKTALKSGLLSYIGKEIDDAYTEKVKSTVLNPDAIARQAEKIKIVYTPLNGTGRVPVLRVLRELGFSNVYTVKEQELPDGNFPTLKYPNPEDPAAFTLALELAKEKNADIVLATDPDADRLGVYVKDEKAGGYVPFTGNMSGLLIAEYELSERRRKGLLKDPRSAAVVTTIVSSRMAEKTAESYGVKLFDVLTGFKYIGEKIKQFETARASCGGYDADSGAYEFIFGFEESYGCLIGTYARDKDAVTAVCALCEAAAFYKERGLTLWGQMQNIYRKYGYFKEDLFTQTFAGADGAAKINAVVDGLRAKPLAEIGGFRVKAIRDYKMGKRTDLSSGAVSPTGLAAANVIYFELENDAWCCVRPSGTEPKIKFYFGVKGVSEKDAKTLLERLKNALLKIAEPEEKGDVGDGCFARLKPAFKDFIWGGTRIKDYFGKDTGDMKRVAESWELSAHPAGESTIANGKYRGLSFGEFVEKAGGENLGEKASGYGKFPLMIKFIDAKDNLSVQVHPDDAYALANGNDCGKNEMWYIVGADDKAFIYLGFNKDVEKDEIREKIKNGTITDILNRIPVKKGQAYFLPAGTVHAIGAGCFICEIQQSSDITYRLYDYNRKDANGNPRPLHIEDALRVIDTRKTAADGIAEYGVTQFNGYSEQLLCRCKYFVVKKYVVNGEMTLAPSTESFKAVVVINGKGKIGNGNTTCDALTGDTWFFGCREPLSVKGELTLLISHL